VAEPSVPAALLAAGLVFFLGLVGATVRLAAESFVEGHWRAGLASLAAAGALFWLGVVVLQSQSAGLS
jgi:hypothetical protein